MRNIFLYFIVSVLTFHFSFAQEKLTSYVDPFIGTAGNGNTFPGAVVPFGMIQLSPDNGVNGRPGGYHYNDNKIAGFSHMHLSGADLGDWLDISVMPLIFPLRGQDSLFEAATFSHMNERASPGYYSVKLDNEIQVELTTTERVGYHRYTFPAESEPTIRFDLAFQQNGDMPTKTFIKKENDSTLVGYRYSTGLASKQKVYFAARTSKPFSEFHLKGELDIEIGDINIGLESEEKGKGIASQLIFSSLDIPQSIELKVALSMTNTDKALLALNEITDWNFDAVRKKADAQWEDELKKIQITTPNVELKKVFYTALYHTAIAPTLYSDADGEYKNAKDEKHQVKSGSARYTLFPLRNTSKALNPLLTLTQPDRYTAMLNSLLSFYTENGLLPVFDLGTEETNAVAGYPAIPVLSDAILKDWPGLDSELIYSAMKESALQQDRNLPDYIKFGYVPQDKNERSVSMTLEYGFNDWSLAAVAKKLGKLNDYETFSQRALAYQNIFDQKTGSIRAKDSDGSWAANFVEGNASQSPFFVPHDNRGLESLYEDDGLEKRLDLFVVGEYDHGNALNHHTPYMYAYLGKPWKTQALVRQLVDSLYHDKPDGYAGNEGFGQLSAWAVWNIAGLYPVNPVGGEYIIGSPMADAVTIQLKGDKKFEVKVLNNNSQNKYIQSVQVNGETYKKSYLLHRDIVNGGNMIVSMGSEPNMKWGSDESWLPSYQPLDSNDVDNDSAKKGFFKSLSDFFDNLFN